MNASRLDFVRSVVAMFAAQVVTTGLATHFVSERVRPFVMVALTIISMMVLATWLGGSILQKVAALILSTFMAMVCVFYWRRWVNPLAFSGPIPASVEFKALGVCGLATSLFSSAMAFVADRHSWAYRYRWGFVIVLSGLVIAGLQSLWFAYGEVSTAMRLRQVVHFEAQLESSGRHERQELSFLLSSFGRGTESQAFSTRYEHPYGRQERAAGDAVNAANEQFSSAVAWRQAVREIAAEHRIVIIMEAHNATEHREWIEQTLPIFHEAGFRHYAAESLSEDGRALRIRGFPVETTGYYVADPRFGNLLRRAISLEFSIYEYEAHFTNLPQEREEQQAQALANIIATNPDAKLLVHAGYSHAFKQPQPGFGQWMAGKLWDKTGIEPYSIYQGHDQYDSPDYRRVAELAGVSDQPKLLIPPPTGLSDPQFADIPAGAIDAFVIHPIVQGKPPVSRKPAFASDMTQISGSWLEQDWPIVVGAFRTGETADAVALDQVMLRHGDCEFELWIPACPYTLRVTSPSGIIKINIERNQAGFRLRKAVAW